MSVVYIFFLSLLGGKRQITHKLAEEGFDPFDKKLVTTLLWRYEIYRTQGGGHLWQKNYFLQL